MRIEICTRTNTVRIFNKKPFNEADVCRNPKGEFAPKGTGTISVKKVKESNLYKQLPSVLKDTVDFIYLSSPVSELKGNEFDKGEESIVDRVEKLYTEKYNGCVENPTIGKVKIDRRSIKDSLAHGIGRNKAAAFAAAPEVIKHGAVFCRAINWKERGYNSCAIAAPITIDGDRYICEAVVTSTENRQGLYLHEVEISEKLADVFKTAINGTSASSRLIIAKEISKIKKKLD